jgi:hypothetical protein
MSNDRTRNLHRAAPLHETQEEFLVSAPRADPSQAAGRLAELVKTVEKVDGVDVVKTIGSSEALKVVVLSSTPSDLQKVAVSFPDLTIEKNQPLELFDPTSR